MLDRAARDVGLEGGNWRRKPVSPGILFRLARADFPHFPTPQGPPPHGWTACPWGHSERLPPFQDVAGAIFCPCCWGPRAHDSADFDGTSLDEADEELLRPFIFIHKVFPTEERSPPPLARR